MDKDLQPMNSEFLLYTTPEGDVKIDVFLQNETVWLTQKKMAELFGVEVNTVNYHLKEIFKCGELDENPVIRKIRITAADGKSYETQFYSLDAIISVGYRVNSSRATKFRIWATKILKEYLLQGFSLNEAKLKTGKTTEYFDKLQEKLREIRLSERVFYQKIKDIYTTSIDYSPKAEMTIQFFQTIQNKLLWAISQKTAAELVHNRVDAAKPFLGMKSYDKKSEKEIIKQDVSIAKNYLNEQEMKTLGLIVEQYLAFAESMAQNQTPMTMADWIDQLDLILKMNRKELLTHYGKISHALAVAKSEKEFEKFKVKKRKIEKAESLKELEKDLKKLNS